MYFQPPLHNQGEYISGKRKQQLNPEFPGAGQELEARLPATCCCSPVEHFNRQFQEHQNETRLLCDPDES